MELRMADKTRLSLLRQKYTQMRNELDAEITGQKNDLLMGYEAAQDRLATIRKRQKIAWYGIGGLGLWRIRNAGEAIADALGNPGR